MDVVDRNERKFKELAEGMIEKSSELISYEYEDTKKLMHFQNCSTIASNFTGTNKFTSWKPFCLAHASGQTMIGTYDGAIRIFD